MSVPSTPYSECRHVEHMSLEELRKEYIALKTAQFSFRHEEEQMNMKIESLREESVRLQQSVEVEEEHAANQLLRRLEGAERDVRKYEQLIADEEQMTKELTLQIHEVRAQQTEVENQLEQHQEYLLLNLQKKLLEVARQKSELEDELLRERQRYLNVLVNQLTVLRGREDPNSEGGSNLLGRTISTHLEDGKPTPTPVATEERVASHEASIGDVPVLFHSCEGGGQARMHSVSAPSSTYQTIVLLEQQLNKLLAEQAKAALEAADTKRRCMDLSQRLEEIQNAACEDRARASKYKENLRDAQTKLSELDLHESSYEDISNASTPRRSFDNAVTIISRSGSLRDRTKELLSAAPPPSSTS